MPLTDTAVRNAKPASKILRLYDEGRLYLEVTPSGGKLWRLKYRFEGKEKLLALGKYPIVSLKEARERRDEAKKLLANGTDPGAIKKAQKAARRAEQDHAAKTFERAALEWFDAWKIDKAETNTERIKGRLTNDVFPWIGRKPIASISPADVFQTCDRIQKRGAKDTAHRVLSYLDAIFKHVIAVDSADKAIQEGKRPARIPSGVNPCTNLRGRNVHLLEPVPKKRHFAHFKDERTGGVSPVKLGEYLRAVDGFTGSYVVHAALRLAPLLFCRPGELRRMRWAEIDLDGRKDWCFTVSKMKAGEEPHKLTVPLSRQAMRILEELRPLTGAGEFVFCGHWDRTRPMSDAAVNAALRRLSFDTQREVSGHGFRHVAASLLRELGYRDDLVEEALGHKKGGIAGVYGHAKYIGERREMMQLWSDHLDRLKSGAEVIPLRGMAA
jgi:integrase